MTANHKVLHIQQTFTITFDAEYNHNYISLSAHLSDFVKGFIEIKILCRYCKPLALVRSNNIKGLQPVGRDLFCMIPY